MLYVHLTRHLISADGLLLREDMMVEPDGMALDISRVCVFPVDSRTRRVQGRDEGMTGTLSADAHVMRHYRLYGGIRWLHWPYRAEGEWREIGGV